MVAGAALGALSVLISFAASFVLYWATDVAQTDLAGRTTEHDKEIAITKERRDADNLAFAKFKYENEWRTLTPEQLERIKLAFSTLAIENPANINIIHTNLPENKNFAEIFGNALKASGYDGQNGRPSFIFVQLPDDYTPRLGYYIDSRPPEKAKAIQAALEQAGFPAVMEDMDRSKRRESTQHVMLEIGAKPAFSPP